MTRRTLKISCGGIEIRPAILRDLRFLPVGRRSETLKNRTFKNIRLISCAFLPRKKAEGVRFELTIHLRRYRISSAAHSTALASLRLSTGQTTFTPSSSRGGHSTKIFYLRIRHYLKSYRLKDVNYHAQVI